MWKWAGLFVDFIPPFVIDVPIIHFFCQKVKSVYVFPCNFGEILLSCKVRINQKEVIMAGSINKVILVGNIGQEPQVRTMQSGQKVVSFSLATSERWRDRASGEQKEQTEWHRVVIFNPNLVEVAERMLQKGTKLYLEGSLRTRKWQNQQGVDVYTTEVTLNQFAGQMVILSGAKALDGMSGDYAAAPAAPAPREEISVADIGDDIPF